MARICPKCQSRNVEPDTGVANWAGEGISNPNQWKCNKCGYTGPMPVE